MCTPLISIRGSFLFTYIETQFRDLSNIMAGFPLQVHEKNNLCNLSTMRWQGNTKYGGEEKRGEEFRGQTEEAYWITN